MKMTPWFAAGVKPRRAGVYRIRYLSGYGYRVVGFAYWSARLGWRQYAATANEARRRNHYPHHALQNNPIFSPQWRGLAGSPQ